MEVSMGQSYRALVDEWTKKITTTEMAAGARLAATMCHCPQRTFSDSSRNGNSQNIRSTNVISATIKHLGSSYLLPFQVLLLSIIILSLAYADEMVAGENNRQASGGLYELHQPFGDSMKTMRSKRSSAPKQQQQQQQQLQSQSQQPSRQAIIPAANPNFEAAFQGECGKNNKNGNPCGHICLDLYDGTYECSCFYGFTLAVDGYSCTPVADSRPNNSGTVPLATSTRLFKQQQPPAVEQAAAPEQRRELGELVFVQDKPYLGATQGPNTTKSGHVSGPQADATPRQLADADISFVATHELADDEEVSDNSSTAKSSLGPSEPRQASDLGRQSTLQSTLPPTARPKAAPDAIGKPTANDNRKLATAAQLARGAESSSSNERGAKISGSGRPDELLRPRQRRLLAASAWLQRRQRQQQESTLTTSAEPGAPREHRRQKANGESQRAITESGGKAIAAMTTLDDNKAANDTARSRRLDSFYYAPAEGSAPNPELIELGSSGGGAGDDGDKDEADPMGLDADIKSIMLDNDQLLEQLASLVETGGLAQPDHRRLRRQQDLAVLELFVNKTMEDYLHETNAEGNVLEAENQSSRPNLMTTLDGPSAGGAKRPGQALLCQQSAPGQREECGRGRGECEWGGQCLAEKHWVSLATQRLAMEQRVSRCQCPIGRGGRLCQKPTQRVLPKFMGKSYLALPMATNRPELVELRLVFKPLEEGRRKALPSLLLYSQKFILLLDPMNRIELRYSSGAQVTRVYGSRDVLMGAWNELVVTPDASNDDNRGASRAASRPHLEVLSERGSKLVAPIDNRIVLVTPDRIQLDTGGELANYSTELFVAGLPDQSRRRRRRPHSEQEERDRDDDDDDVDDASDGDGILNGVEGLGAAKGLRGCVGELSINGRRYKFNSDLNGDALDGFDIAECCEATLVASAPEVRVQS